MGLMNKRRVNSDEHHEKNKIDSEQIENKDD